MKNRFFLLAVGLVVFGLGFFILNGEQANAANAATRPFLKTIASAGKISDQDVLTVTALAATFDGQPAGRIEMKISDTNYKCLSTFFCQQTVGPFTVKKPTWFNYRVTAIDVQGQNLESGQTVTGRFLVTPTKKDTQKPVFTKITTSNHQVTPGGNFSLEINTKDNKGISKIEIFLDGNLLKTCSSVKTCGTTVGPLTDEDIGEHKYVFVVTDTDGNYIKPWGKFWVRSTVTTIIESGVDTEAPQVRISGNLTSQTLEGGQQYEIKSVATDNSGQISRTEIFITEIGQTVGSPVFTCGAKPSPSTCTEANNTILQFNKRYAYQAYAYDAAGNRGMSMMYYFDTPEFDRTLPQIILVPSKDNPLPGEKVTLTAHASDNYRIRRIEIRKSDVVKTCEWSDTCTFSTGPLTAGEHRYDAAAYDAADNQAWSGWVILNVAGGNTPILRLGNDTEAPIVSVEAAPNTSTNAEGHGFVYTVTGNDNSGVVNKMEFFIAAEGEDYAQLPTFTCSRYTNPNTCGNIGFLPGGRNYHFQAKAFDDAGNIGYSPNSFFWMPI